MSQSTAQKLRALKEHPFSKRLLVEELLDILVEEFPESEAKTYTPVEVVYNVFYTLPKWHRNNIDYYPATGKQIIKSVKRKSDGEVFKIGDLMHYKSDTMYEGYGCEIQYFTVVDDKIFVNRHDTNTDDWDRRGNIDNWMKWILKPKAILTTEDGVEIYDEVFLWGLNPFFGKSSSMSTGVSYFPKSKWFSTEKARDEYILNFKPLLSVADLNGINSSERLAYSSSLIRSATELAKLKLSNA